MGRGQREIACLFYESYWETLNKAIASKRKRADMAYALLEAFFTGKPQDSQFKGEAWGTYRPLEDRVFYSRMQAAKGRDGGRSKGASKAQAKAQANAKQSANPNTKEEIKEKKEKKESGSKPQSSQPAPCPKCGEERTQIVPGMYRCDECDITWKGAAS